MGDTTQINMQYLDRVVREKSLELTAAKAQKHQPTSQRERESVLFSGLQDNALEPARIQHSERTVLRQTCIIALQASCLEQAPGLAARTERSRWP